MEQARPVLSVTQTRDVDDEVDRAGHLLTDRAERQVHARHQRQGLETRDGIPKVTKRAR